MLALGTAAPDFALPDPSGRLHRLSQYRESPALLLAFICNHCPYVKHVLPAFVTFAREYGSRGLTTLAISSNDVSAYPQDAPDEMARLAAALEFPFPYLYDESQAVALGYQAVCTPDFFLFDRSRRLVYRGQFDGSRPGNGVAVTGADLRNAVDALLAGRPVPAQQTPSVGCSMKWKKNNAPEWA
jgi:peroxiredoxin